MEIHSSSLRFIPNRVEAKKTNDNQQLAPSDDSLKTPVPISSQSLAISTNSLNVNDIDLLSNDINSLKKNLFKNIHSNRALNAYIQENIQPLMNQRSELVTRVDFYI
ncbi:MAG: hypothetical protein KAH20_15680 [Methylococcales bacterium]|nr:hypothetical protein [Methylococcales bacterium]